MARKKQAVLTDSEQEIMEILWRVKEASVRDITDELSKSKVVAHTTVQTMFKILHEKGHVDYRKEGRAFIYFPLKNKASARSDALKNVLKQFFGGSPDVLAQHLLEENDIDLDTLQTLQDKIDKSKQGKGA
ncbi:BlaI/MecI/CopY family transcriptional regulator [Shewanella benthica]|uniref:BlaI/MecI/CopY family transcriptional regulator n=1 Tax=Shewanella TaxID=22 RepID=UPI000C0D6331|nr:MULTISPECIES: BlaI/MecI/CopY family transcriptional regulator [Shewanella]MBE7214147.1 BlaI/MecI/CopY family transcriptional regulator [Shewanella benthica]MBL4814922.1 BlaI/MecI/CopY family transcriptional regulator [Shewanella sp.]MCJ8303514.1 BlaI/MecI/CopY family transcriptional regulator [Shewanella sp.]MCL1061388.1 BlaI/MecI/CopY family transcriptional regulator [Shewanella benthica]PHQ75710.1 MAG: MarR family transcriptional regulator [Shewanella sp.]